MEATKTQSEETTIRRQPDAGAMAGLAALRQRVVQPEATPSPAAPVAASQPRRESNGELLHRARFGRTDSERNRAAEELRRRVKTLCAAALDRYTGQLTAQESDDLTQEVMVKLLCAASDENSPIEVTPAYVQRVAVNLLIDQRRRLDRRGLNKPGLSVDDTEAAVMIPDPTVQVEEEVLGKFHQYQIRAALQQALSPTEAKVLWLRVGDGLSHAEIADELGIKEANARKHYERGLKRLRTHIETGAFAAV